MSERSIILTSNFTQQNHSGFGNSPGAFLKEYVARDDATEQWNNQDVSVKDAVALDDQNGRVFGGEGLVYDNEQLEQAAKMFDQAYQNGQTVQRMVVSFDTDNDYLTQEHAMPKFKHQQKGDFKNNVDELKIRAAITNGVNQMTSQGHYQEPYWAGSVQVNTDHVHSHIVMCDKDSRSRVRQQDGEQQGSFSQQEMQAFKNGVQDYFNDSYALDANATMLQAQKQYHHQKQKYQQNQQQRLPAMHKYNDPQVDKKQKNKAIKKYVNVDQNQPINNDDYVEATRIMQQQMKASKKRKKYKLKQYQKRYDETLKKVDRLAKRFEHTNGKLQDFYQGELEYQMQVFDRYRKYLGNPKDKIDPPKSAFDEWRNGQHDRDIFLKERNPAMNQVMNFNQKIVPDLERDVRYQKDNIDPEVLAYNENLQRQRGDNAKAILSDRNLSGLDRVMITQTLNESVNASRILENVELQMAQRQDQQPTVERDNSFTNQASRSTSQTNRLER